MEAAILRTRTAAISPARHRFALLELPVALLCVWAAWFHTPVGALIRDVAARAIGRRSTARPLLSFFSGGESELGVHFNGVLPPSAPVSGDRALALGVEAALRSLPKAERESRLEAVGLRSEDPAAMRALLDKLARADGSTDAAVLELFAGEAPTRYAIERARASHDPLTIDVLTQALPPGLEGPASTATEALALGTAYGLSWPLERPVQVNSGFGMRLHPVLGERLMHTGLDLEAPLRTPVHAAADGVVRRASEDGVNGRLLILDHGHGVSTAYCHNERLLVHEGEKVRRGQVIALSGATGRVTGPHLHYQLELLGHPVDPLAFRPKPGALVKAGGE